MIKQDKDKPSDKIDEPPKKDKPVSIDDPKPEKPGSIDEPQNEPNEKDIKLHDTANKKGSHRQRRIGSYFRMALRNTSSDDKQ